MKIISLFFNSLTKLEFTQFIKVKFKLYHDQQKKDQLVFFTCSNTF